MAHGTGFYNGVMVNELWHPIRALLRRSAVVR